MVKISFIIVVVIGKLICKRLNIRVEMKMFISMWWCLVKKLYKIFW